MTIFVRGDVVKVAFPGDAAGSAEGNDTALVVSPVELQRDRGLLWVVPVMKQGEGAWKGDLPILDNAVAGVAPGSVVRTACVGTVHAQAAKRVGRIPGPLLAKVLGQITGALGRL